MKKVLSLLVVFLSGPMWAAEDQKPAEVFIENLEANGSGCPLDSVEKNIAADGQSFSLYFYEYLAEIGPDIKRSEARKACQVTLNLTHSPGWRFSVVAFEFRGFADLDEGVLAEHQTRYYFQGEQRTLVFEEEMPGPMIDSFWIQNEVGPTERFWSSCETQRAINILSGIKLAYDKEAKDGIYGGIGTDSLDGRIGTQTWKIQWEKCEDYDNVGDSIQ